MKNTVRGGMTALAGEPLRGSIRGAGLKPWLWASAMSVLWVSGLLIWQWNAHPPDFSALYFAATAFREGKSAEVYAANELLFDGTVSRYWSELAFEQGFSGKSIYPYVYPPLWASVLAPVTDSLTLTEFTRAGLLAQAPLIPLSAFLAHRLCGSRQSIAVWMAVSLILAVSSIVGSLALLQNQPQLLVAFLILLAFERQKSGRPLAAGAALALAAAIKLYPAILVLFWLLRRDKAPVLWFCVFGAALAAASLVSGGYDLHVLFLERVRGISDIVLGVSTATGMETLLFQIWYPSVVAEAFRATRAGSDLPMLRGFIAVQPGWFSPVIYLSFAASLAAVFSGVRRAGIDDTMTVRLPISLIVMSFFAPLSWYYHILPALLIAPVLIERLRPRTGFLVLIAFALLTSYGVNALLSKLPVDFLVTPFVGFGAYLLLIAAFWSARERGAVGAR